MPEVIVVPFALFFIAMIIAFLAIVAHYIAAKNMHWVALSVLLMSIGLLWRWL
jgi:hypothetical protein